MTVIGVYPLDPSAALVRDAALTRADDQGPPEEWAQALEKAEAELKTVVMIELRVTAPGSSFDTYDLCQPGVGQVAWLTTRLTPDGARVADRIPPRRFPNEPEVRVVFFLHYFDARKPLTTSVGPIALPPTVEMPDRLRAACPYTPPD